MKEINGRIIIIFSVSFIMTLLLLDIGTSINKYFIHQKMVQYSIASVREDGVENRVVMIGIPGYIGESLVYLNYLENGYIELSGSNPEEQYGWKKLSEFVLDPGTYTLTGMKGLGEQIIALQLRISDDKGFYRYIYQYNEDVEFKVDQQSEATLHVMIYPLAENIDVIVRPAVYKEGGAI